MDLEELVSRGAGIVGLVAIIVLAVGEGDTALWLAVVALGLAAWAFVMRGDRPIRWRK